MASGPDSKRDEESTPWTDEAQSQYANKRFSEYYDPCQEVAEKSLRCLHRNGGDRTMCSDYFQAYRDCKKQWISKRNDAKRKAPKDA